MSEGKLCKYCELFKSLNQFNFHKTTKDGFNNKCKDCCSKWNKEYNLRTRPGYDPKNLDKMKLCPSDPNLKICTKCMKEKPIVEFRHRKYGRNNHLYGPTSQCISCEMDYKIIYKQKMKGNRPPKPRDQQIRNREYIKQKKLNDPIYREKCLKRKREKANTEESRKKARIQRKKWLENPTNRIAKNMRDRMRSALKGLSKKSSTLNMTGISFEDFKLYLESKFEPGMCWENYGSDWHIDHIIPCNFFNFELEEHQKICFYYKNLQPLWAKDNILKHDNITIDNFDEFIDNIKKELKIFS